MLSVTATVFRYNVDIAMRKSGSIETFDHHRTVTLSIAGHASKEAVQRKVQLKYGASWVALNYWLANTVENETKPLNWF